MLLLMAVVIFVLLVVVKYVFTLNRFFYPNGHPSHLDSPLIFLLPESARSKKNELVPPLAASA